MASENQQMNIVVSGMFGGLNLGDEAVCLAVVSGLKKLEIKSCFNLISHDCVNTKALFPDDEIHCYEGQCFTHVFWKTLLKFFRVVASADVIIVGGGGLFQDQYSWHLPSSSALMALIGA